MSSLRGSIVEQDDTFPHRFHADEFDCDRWQATPAFAHLSGGRGGSCRIRAGGEDCVLRSYLRGGWIASIVEDRYLWLGRRNSRPAQEMRALDEARRHGLPVPRFVAYRLQVRGLFYRAAIISRYIPHVATLGALLRMETLDAGRWNRLGNLIRRMHEAGINHADLNANNILIDAQGDFHLIDFDKARIRQLAGAWQQANLERLKRSLEKQRRLHDGLHFDERQWQALVVGYNG